MTAAAAGQRVPFPLCPVAEQVRLPGVTDTVSARARTEAAMLDSCLDDLTSLDAALLARAFRGELVPQDPAGEPPDVLLARLRAARADAPTRRSHR